MAGSVASRALLGQPGDPYVHPRTVRIPFDATGFQVDVEGVVTASCPASGRTFHAARLAMSQVMIGARFIIIDAALPRSSSYDSTRATPPLPPPDRVTTRSSGTGESFYDGVSVGRPAGPVRYRGPRARCLSCGQGCRVEARCSTRWLPDDECGGCSHAVLARRAFASRSVGLMPPVIAPLSTVSDAEASTLAQVTPGRDV